MPFTRSFYRLFFRNAKPSDFDLIIETEHFDPGVARFSQMIGMDIRPQKVSTLAQISANAASQEQAIFANDGVMEKIMAMLRDEIAFYEQVLSWEPTRLGRPAL